MHSSERIAVRTEVSQPPVTETPSFKKHTGSIAQVTLRKIPAALFAARRVMGKMHGQRRIFLLTFMVAAGKI